MKRFPPAALTLALWIGSPLTVPAHADGPGHEGHHGPGPMMQRIDTNRDGAIDREEAKAAPWLAERFDRIDANRDGSLGKAELDTAQEHHRERREERGAERFEDSDRNGDGAIDMAEAKSAAEKRTERMFERMDANRDGKLTREEMSRHAPPPSTPPER